MLIKSCMSVSLLPTVSSWGKRKRQARKHKSELVCMYALVLSTHPLLFIPQWRFGFPPASLDCSLPPYMPCPSLAWIMMTVLLNWCCCWQNWFITVLSDLRLCSHSLYLGLITVCTVCTEWVSTENLNGPRWTVLILLWLFLIVNSYNTSIKYF